MSLRPTTCGRVPGPGESSASTVSRPAAAFISATITVRLFNTGTGSALAPANGPSCNRHAVARRVALSCSGVTCPDHSLAGGTGTPSSFVLVDTRTQTRGSSVENTYAFDSTETLVRVRPGRQPDDVPPADHFR